MRQRCCKTRKNMLQLNFLIVCLLWLQQVFGQSNTTCPFSNCKKCSNDLESCEECLPNFIFSREENKCYYMGTCAPGEFKNSTTGICEQCESSCRTCSSKREYDCNSCLEGYYPYFISYGLGLIKKCFTCHVLNCKECEGQQNCNKCYEGFWLDETDGNCKNFSFFFFCAENRIL